MRLWVWIVLVCLGQCMAARSAWAYPVYASDNLQGQPCTACHKTDPPTMSFTDFGTGWQSSACYKQSWGSPACVGSSFYGADPDQDHYKNSDEMLAGTNPGVAGYMDECSYQFSRCSQYAFCTDGPSYGDWTCTCAGGFSPAGSSQTIVCTDIDECAAPDGGNCGANSSCHNLPGTHSCPCNDGFFGDGSNGNACTFVDACLKVSCSPVSSCGQTGTQTSCAACPKGYAGDGVTCADINECGTSNGGCDAATACTNIPGFRTCGACPAGTEGDGATGCTKKACSGCDAHAVCDESQGTGCRCLGGFSGDGKTCTDNDECQGGGCTGETCTNLPGTFLCSCPPGAGASTGTPPSASSNRPRSVLAPSDRTSQAAFAALLAALLACVGTLVMRPRRFVTLAVSAVLVAAIPLACGSSGNAGSHGPSADAGNSSSAAGTSSGHGETGGATGDAGAAGEAGTMAIIPDGGAGVPAMVPQCTASCQCAASDWCNPATAACESREPATPIVFDDVIQVFRRNGCVSCHAVGEAGDVDPRNVGAHLLFVGDASDTYASTVAGGFGCGPGVNRVCVDEPARSLLATQTLDDPQTEGKPSVAFAHWSDPDMQTILRWIASGAPRRSVTPVCGDHVVDPGEECDEGPTPATRCAYGSPTCTLCDAHCKSYAGTGPYCGDKALDVAHETCDDGNTSVDQVGTHGGATCGAQCSLVAGSPCGGGGQNCCTIGAECGTDLACSSGVCQPTCGASGTPCCDHQVSTAQIGGCQSGLQCTSDVCVACPGGHCLLSLEPYFNASYLTLDAERVYLSGYYGVASVPLPGGARLDLSTDSSGPVVTNAGSAFWVRQGNVNKDVVAISTLGGLEKVLDSSNGGDPSSSVTIDANNLYWGNGDIIKIPLSGAAPSIAMNLWGTGLLTALIVATNGSSICWAYYGYENYPAGGVECAPDTAALSGTEYKFAGGTQKSKQLAITMDSSNVYWTDGLYGGLYKASISSGSTTQVVLAYTNTTITSVAVDSSYVYYTETTSNTVRKISISGGSPITVATGQSAPASVAVDADGVYWLSGGHPMKLTPK